MKKLFNYISLFIITVALMLINMNVSKAINIGGPNDCGDLNSQNCRIINGTKIIVNPNGFRSVPELDFTKVTHANRSHETTYPYWRQDVFNWYDSGNNKQEMGYERYFLTSNNPLLFRDKDIFCLQAQLGGGNDDGILLLGAERFLIDPHEGPQNSAYDVAMISALTNTPSTGLSDGDVYQARKMAIRAIHFVWGYDSYPSNDDDGSRFWNDLQFQGFYLYWNNARKWIVNDPTAFNNLQTAVRGKFNINNLSSYKDTIEKHGLCSDNSCANYHYAGTKYNAVDAEAQRYFNEALQAAADYLNNFNNSSKVTRGSQDVSEVVVSGPANNQLLTRDYPIKFTVSNLRDENNNEFVINGIKEEHIPSGVTAEITTIKIGDNELHSDALGTNLIRYFDGSDTEVEIIVKISGYKNDLDCADSQIKFSLDGYYSNTEFGEYGKYTGIVWWIDNINNPGNPDNYQRFLGLIDSNNSNPKNDLVDDLGTFTTSLIEACSCTELLDSCEAGNPDACEDLEDHKENCSCEYLDYVCTNRPSSSDCSQAQNQYGEVCSSCSSTIDTVSTCCSKATDKLLVSSREDDYQDPYTINGVDPDRGIKACFVTAIDNQYHSGNLDDVGIEDQKGNTYTVTKNNYCAISCTEDYQIYLPKAKLTQAGRYFDFNAKIIGTKTCTTNTIRKDQFETDANAAKINLIAKYNEWLGAKETFESLEENPSAISCDYYYDDCGDLSYQICSISGYSHRYTGYDNEGNRNQNRSYTFSSGTYGSVGSHSGFYCTGCQSGDNEVCNTVNGHEDCTCYASCRSGYVFDPENRVCRYTSESGDVTNSYGANSRTCPYYNREYHGCRSHPGYNGDPQDVLNEFDEKVTAAWTAYTIARDAYNEIINEYVSCTSPNEWDTEIKFDPDVTYDYDENKYMELHNPSIGNMSANPTITNSDSYADTYGDWHGKTPEQFSKIECDRSGCTSKEIEIGTDKFSRTISEVNAIYSPDRVFYNSYRYNSEIWSSESDTYYDPNNSTQVKGLPVDSDSKSGAHNYHVYVTNLGEFYDTGQLGKYFNSTSSSRSVFDLKQLEYDCSYLINILYDVASELVCDYDGTCNNNCVSDCVGPNCDDDDYCTGVNCEHNCVGVGCLYDSDVGVAYFDNQVSLKNLFPNDTQAYNWKNDKGEYTKNIIEDKYVNGQPGDDGDSVFETTPVLSVTLTPQARSEIRRYNSEQEGNGGYYNPTLTCKSLLSSGTDRIGCYSSFITDLINGNYSAVVNNSTIINKRNIDNPRNGYFETWNRDVSELNMIGPAWR